MHTKPQRNLIIHVPCTSNTPEKMMRNISQYDVFLHMDLQWAGGFLQFHSPIQASKLPTRRGSIKIRLPAISRANVLMPKCVTLGVKVASADSGWLSKVDAPASNTTCPGHPSPWIQCQINMNCEGGVNNQFHYIRAGAYTVLVLGSGHS